MARGFRLLLPACFLALAAVSLVVAPPILALTHSPGRARTPSWTVYHDNPAGSGVAVGVASVYTAGRAWKSPTLDGQLYGEPLVFGGRVYVATENDTVYALSAATGAVVWSARLGTAVPSGGLRCGNITPTVGITGTPAIDQTRHEIFVVAAELRNGKLAHMLVGLNTASGQVELSQDVDPPGQPPANILQRTGLTLDKGHVYFGFGGNAEDCGFYRGRLVSVPESGGTPRFFTVDARPGDSQGAIWMGGAAPAVGPNGDLWVATGNGSVHYRHGYDNSDAVLEISPSLRLLQFFAPASWKVNNSDDLDMATEPVLLPDGQVILAGKSQVVYLLNGRHLGGIGKQQAELSPVCATNMDGGSADPGMTAYLPCLSGTIAVKATRSPPALHLLWSSNVGGGPPIMAGGLVWTIGQNGKLYGLDPATGTTRQQASIGGRPANHFPTPGIGAGLMLAASAQNVIAFRTATSGTGQVVGRTMPASRDRRYPPPGSAPGERTIAEIALSCLVAAGTFGWFIWLIRRRRRT